MYGVGDVMSFVKIFLMLVFLIPGPACSMGSFLLEDGAYFEGYYMPSTLEKRTFSVRRILGTVSKEASSLESYGALADHDVTLRSSLSAYGGGLGITRGVVGLKFSLDYGNFPAKKVGAVIQSAREDLRRDVYISPRIRSVSDTAFTVSVCREQHTKTFAQVFPGVSICVGGGVTLVSVAPGSYVKLAPSLRIKGGMFLPLDGRVALSFSLFYHTVLGTGGYESVYDVTPELAIKPTVVSWGLSGVESKLNLDKLGIELGLRFNLRLDGA